ncbi:MAG: hypothetical protein WCA08_05500 [Desulfoferrobacter sp.]
MDSKTLAGMYYPAAFLRASGLAVRAAFLSLRSVRCVPFPRDDISGGFAGIDETRFAERSLLAGAKDVQFKRPLQIITAGAPPAPTVIKNMESLGINVTQVYGLTEVFGPHSICEWQTKWDGLDLEER